MSTAAINKSDAELERLEQSLRIDKYSLDDELIEQAHYYNEVAQRFADTVSYRDEAKADFEGTKAKIDLQIRQKFAQANEKITEAGVEARVVVHPEYQNTLVTLAAWSDRVNRWSGLRDAIQQRGYALKDLSTLYTAGYWGDRSGSSVSRDVKTERADAARGKLVEKTRERRKFNEAAQNGSKKP
jgi:hypothetical protein